MKPVTNAVCTARIATPFAVIGIRVQDEKLMGVQYLAMSTPILPPRDALSREVCRQIRAYLVNSMHAFDLPYVLEGTQFQREGWLQIARIPSRETRSYGDLARLVNSAPRAVGQACGSNPVPLIVPCHRVVAANGGLGGFMHSQADFSLGVKRWLLRHEGH